jgi:hypothetical protein
MAGHKQNVLTEQIITLALVHSIMVQKRITPHRRYHSGLRKLILHSYEELMDDWSAFHRKPAVTLLFTSAKTSKQLR